ncbi:hypothetical protein EXS70_00875 [Candidatus Peribacteria bacterium]|nr:hypothetical protein [Candidatus Peribacteria bacterium]
MTSLLFGISLSALLSTTSLLVVIFRVSPLTAPAYALPAFFLSLFLAVSSVGTLLWYALWRVVPLHSWDLGKILGISVRQGVFLGLGTVVLVLFHLLGLLTWWIAMMIYGVFVLIELALNS